MRGTEKQIKWAKDIEVKVYEVCEKIDGVEIKKLFESIKDDAAKIISTFSDVYKNDDKMISLETHLRCNKISLERYGVTIDEGNRKNRNEICKEVCKTYKSKYSA